MYIFLDESGDLGFNFEKGSSTHFVITLLICKNREAALSIKAAVKHTLKRKCYRKKTPLLIKELKSTQTLLSTKKYFLDNLCKQKNQSWCLYSIILNKKDLFDKIKKVPDKNRLYNLLSKIILQQVDFSFHQNGYVYLVADSSKGKEQRAVFNQYLKTNIEQALNLEINLRIEHKKSHDSAGLQAVDLFCAGFSRKYSYRDVSWYNLFKNRICKEMLFDIKQNQ